MSTITQKAGSPHLRLIRSERVLVRDSVRFRVPNLFWQYVSAFDQGAVLVKKCCSWVRASAHVGLEKSESQMSMTTQKAGSSHLRLIRSERILFRDSARFGVPNLFWQYIPAPDQGAVLEKKCCSWAQAFAHVIPVFKSFDPGCFTINHPFVSGSASFRMKRNQCSSSPGGIRSGLVRTPIKHQSMYSRNAGADLPIVRLPSWSCCFAM